MSQPPVMIGPSILSADFLRLGEEIAEAEAAGVDYIHVDIMDGRYVPNISVGLPVVAAVRRTTTLPVDVHLMIVEPERYVQAFADAGATTLTVHVEATTHLHRTMQAITEVGAKPSVALNPATPLVMVEDILPQVSQVLIMSVNPGFGGQAFLPGAVQRIRRLRELALHANPECIIQVDGGITDENVGSVVGAGASSIVAGSALFGAPVSLEEAVAQLRRAVSER
jgi:ribulose-phosphate 3-epimerase